MAKVRSPNLLLLVSELRSPRIFTQAIVPKMVGEVIDRAMQVHGAEGICRSSCIFPLPVL